ncbi:MAG: M28 family peptidase [Bdellovibrionales bacterium]|nr:M28 family peptidase [Bdellovibrionales bacterium]
MKCRWALACVLILLSGCKSTAPKSAPEAPSTNAATPTFIRNMRQLTFEGARAGEGYFSRDGRYLIFQSEREKNNPFYQMYVMDTKTGATTRVSPGQGKTTCGWIHPSNRIVLFSSTHADPQVKQKAEAEWAERKNPKQRYSWNFDETYDIYQSNLNGKGLKNLTKVKGYDAEGSYSPDGKLIAFASNRSAYDGSMSEGDKKAFERDPSYMMDIYIMNANGSGVKRLTTDAGYDGGPFFSPDGKSITYRHFTADGKTAEVYTMKIDGSDRKQITRLGAMSWAPFYHPSGDYLIFASNKYGYQNFELFIVDREGLRDPVRATDMAGFDGLPVFTPDGLNLVWTHANEKGEAQLYRAQWDDAAARKALGLAPHAPKASHAWVEYLADPYFEGRLTGSVKEKEYTQALADAFKAMGLKPGAGSSYIQTYEFTSGLELGPKNDVQVDTAGKSETLAQGRDWMPLSYSKNGEFNKAAMVFAGYGITAPATGQQAAYNSYEGLDVKNKWAVVFSSLPEDITNERRFFLHIYSRLQHKALAARQNGAIGLVVIDDVHAAKSALKLNFEGRSEDAGLAVIRFSPEAAERLFAGAKTSRQEWTRKLATGQTASFTFPQQLQAHVDLIFKKSSARNVLAMLPAANAKSTVLVGAHLDHLGHGELGNSLTPGKHLPHVGADDNASGVAGIMEIAAQLSQRVKSGEFKPKQNILFGLWTGEEIGILGSAYFARTDTRKLSASLNLDMIGRYRDQLMVQGVASAREWKGLVEQTNAIDPLNIQTQEDPYVPSDGLTFYMKGLPSIMLFTGSHPQYHTPSDTPDLINYEGLAKVASFGARIVERLASAATSPVTYQKVESTNAQPARGLRLYLGTIPDYARELPQGVAITGTSKGSPAEKAGLLAGDVILELGGIKIKNLQDYVYCLQALKANQKTTMRILRAGQERELQIVPLAK